MLDIEHECCRDGLYVAQTGLSDENGRRHSFMGLFTRRKIRKGEFIGFYTGEWFTECAYQRLRPAQRAMRDAYAVSLSSDLVVSPPMNRRGRRDLQRRPDMKKHPLSMANEPSLHRQANVILKEYSFLYDEIESGVDEERADESFDAIGLVACRDIGRNREIFWSYGPHYPRPYPAGKNCRQPEAAQDPASLYEFIPLCAVPAFIHS